MRKLPILLTALVLLSTPALADEHWRHEFHDRDVHRFHGRDHDVWRDGYWRQDWHGGVYGWWWVAGGMWYLYERPVYPYPMIVSERAYPDVIVVTPQPVPQPPTVVQQAPPPPGSPPMWYYCDNPAGYYPAVPTCPTPFRAVPAQPPQTR